MGISVMSGSRILSFMGLGCEFRKGNRAGYGISILIIRNKVFVVFTVMFSVLGAIVVRTLLHRMLCDCCLTI